MLCHWAAHAEKGSWTRYTPKLRLFIILAARWGGIVDMSRWRHILLAPLPSPSTCTKPTAENPDATDSEIKSGDIIPYAGLLSACALRDRRKAAAFNKVDALSGTEASPLPNAHSRKCDPFMLSRALGQRRPVELFLAHRAEILPPHRRFVVTRMARDGRAVAGDWLVESVRGGQLRCRT